MPPKQRITKDIILEHALKIAEQHGISAVTSRSVAQSIECSVQPVFSQFATMEELRQATFDYACSKFVQEILLFKDMPDFLPRTTIWVIDLAKNKPNLFHLIYLSDSFHGNVLIDVMMNYETNKSMITKISELYCLDDEKCKDILLRSFLFLLGIGTMICVNHMEFSDDQIIDMMKKTVADMVEGAKRGVV